MTCREILKIIEEKYDRSYAMNWDNVGLLAGRYEKEVNKIYIALDATDEVVEAAVQASADMLITHHPLMMSGMKKINDDDFIGKRLIKLIQNDISYYAMHTNYDVRGMADLACTMLPVKELEVLEVTAETEGIGRVANLKEPLTLLECCNLVKESFALDFVKVFGDLKTKITRVAICPGSGKSVINTALMKGAEVLITGDIGHHDGIDAVANKLAIIDAGHYGLEYIFIKDMVKYLRERLYEVEITGAEIRHPFVIL